MALCRSDGSIERVCVKILKTGLYKQVNWREKSNKVPCSSFNIHTIASLHAALRNVCVLLHQVVCVCLSVCPYEWSVLVTHMFVFA